MSRRLDRRSDRRRRAAAQLSVLAALGAFGALASAIVLPMTDAATTIDTKAAEDRAERRRLAETLVAAASAASAGSGAGAARAATTAGGAPSGAGGADATGSRVEDVYRSPNGATVAWFDRDGALEQIDASAPMTDGRIDAAGAPPTATAYRSSGSLIPQRNGRLRFAVDDAATCTIAGDPVRSGTIREVRRERAVPYECAVQRVDAQGLRWTPVEGDVPVRPVPGDHAAGGAGLPSVSAPGADGADDDVEAAASKDTDKDGIKDDWEKNGYTVTQAKNGAVSVVAWDDAKHEGATDPMGNPYVRYATSPAKASTNDDPWTDLQKVTTVQLLPGISPEARHPLVAAVPDVEVDMERYRVIRVENWSDSSGGSAVQGVTRSTTSRTSREQTVGGQAECGSHLGMPSCSVSVNYSNTSTTESLHREAKQNSSSEDWRTEMSSSADKAAKILPSIRFRNTGTVPLVNAAPKFTLTVDGQSVASLRSTPSTMLDHALPGHSYPAAQGAALAYERVDNFWGVDDLMIDLDTYNKLQDSEPGDVDVTVATTDFDGAVVFVDADDGLPFESVARWKDVLGVVSGTNAAIIVENADGTTTKRRIAAPTTTKLGATVPQLTLGESLKLTHGVEERDGHWFLGDVELTDRTYELTMSPESLDLIADQDYDSIFDMELKGGMSVALKEVAARG